MCGRPRLCACHSSILKFNHFLFSLIHAGSVVTAPSWASPLRSCLWARWVDSTQRGGERGAPCWQGAPVSGTHSHQGDLCLAACPPILLQIPTTMPEEALHAMFAPFGNITELHMLKKNPGAGELWYAVDAEMAFVLLSESECEVPPCMTSQCMLHRLTPVSLWCAFVMFDRWSACEAAIAGLHGKTHLEGAKMPLVVKFADAKVWTRKGARPGCRS
eukprot:1159725-Pelagomonas_calceolata.AAC.12